MDPIIQELARRVNEEGDPEAIEQLLELVRAGNEEAATALLWSQTPQSRANTQNTSYKAVRAQNDSAAAAPLMADPFEKILQLAQMLYGGAEPAAAAAPATSSRAAMTRASAANPAMLPQFGARVLARPDAGPNVPYQPGRGEIVHYLMEGLRDRLRSAQDQRRVEAYQYSAHGRVPPAGESAINTIQALRDTIRYNDALLKAGSLPKLGTRPAGSAIAQFIQAHNRRTGGEEKERKTTQQGR